MLRNKYYTFWFLYNTSDFCILTSIKYNLLISEMWLWPVSVSIKSLINFPIKLHCGDRKWKLGSYFPRIGIVKIQKYLKYYTFAIKGSVSAITCQIGSWIRIIYCLLCLRYILIQLNVFFSVFSIVVNIPL